MIEFYSERKSVARKQYRCEMCNGPIPAGQKYYRETGKYDGEFFSRPMHIHCHLMERKYSEECDNEFDWCNVVDYMAECYCDDCEHGRCNQDKPGWVECDHELVTECPRIKSLLMAEYGEEE